LHRRALRVVAEERARGRGGGRVAHRPRTSPCRRLGHGEGRGAGRLRARRAGGGGWGGGGGGGEGGGGGGGGGGGRSAVRETRGAAAASRPSAASACR